MLNGPLKFSPQTWITTSCLSLVIAASCSSLLGQESTHHQIQTPIVDNQLVDLAYHPEANSDATAAGVAQQDSAFNAEEVAKVLNAQDHSLEFGGFVKLDAIFDFDAIGSTDFFAANQIPTDGSEGRNFRVHARQTRLNLTSKSKLADEDLKLFVEGDFFGNGNSLRLRHAYAKYRGFTIGQTWSTFMDETISPDLVNFESPIGELNTRRGLLRWSHQLPSLDRGFFSVAIEDPRPTFDSPEGQFESAVPDLVMRLRTTHDNSHFQIGGFGSAANFTPLAGEDSSVGAWGFAASGSRKIRRADRFIWQTTIGEGYERFRGFQSYDLDSTGALFAIPAWSYFVGFEHAWSPTLKTVVAYSYANLDSQEATSQIADSLDYFACNVMWKPNKRVKIGAEYLYGSRQEVDGSAGDAHRIQFGFWYYLN